MRVKAESAIRIRAWSGKRRIPCRHGDLNGGLRVAVAVFVRDWSTVICLSGPATGSTAYRRLITIRYPCSDGRLITAYRILHLDFVIQIHVPRCGLGGPGYSKPPVPGYSDPYWDLPSCSCKKKWCAPTALWICMVFKVRFVSCNWPLVAVVRARRIQLWQFLFQLTDNLVWNQQNHLQLQFYRPFLNLNFSEVTMHSWSILVGKGWSRPKQLSSVKPQAT